MRDVQKTEHLLFSYAQFLYIESCLLFIPIHDVAMFKEVIKKKECNEDSCHKMWITNHVATSRNGDEFTYLDGLCVKQLMLNAYHNNVLLAHRFLMSSISHVDRMFYN